MFLFDRTYRLVVGEAGKKGLEIAPPFHIEFSVEKTAKEDPNKCQVKIYNLKPDTRRALEKPDAFAVLYAGYGENAGAVVLAADSGLVGFPERFAQAATGKAAKGKGEKGAAEKKRYGWKVKSLLLPQVNPSDVLKLESRQANGFFRVESVKHSGGFDGGDWVSEFELFDLNEPPAAKQANKK